MNKNNIIIGIGDGAEQSHYTRKPFWDINIHNTHKTCQKCNRTPVFGRQVFCGKCAKIRAKEQRCDYARKTRENRKVM